MSSRPNSFARAALAAALIATATAAAADVLIVRSSGPSAPLYPPGRRLPDRARIGLRATDQLLLLDAGGTRTLRGPGTFAAAGGPQRMASAQPLQTQRRARVGAVRGVEGGELLAPSLWHVDIARGGNFCLGGATSPILWRKDAGAALPVTVTRLADGASRTTAFEAGASTARWPADLTPGDGARYRLVATGAAQPTDLTFRAMPVRPSRLEDMASALIAKACTAQLDLLIEAVRQPGGPPRG